MVESKRRKELKETRETARERKWFRKWEDGQGRANEVEGREENKKKWEEVKENWRRDERGRRGVNEEWQERT